MDYHITNTIFRFNLELCSFLKNLFIFLGFRSQETEFEDKISESQCQKLSQLLQGNSAVFLFSYFTGPFVAEHPGVLSWL